MSESLKPPERIHDNKDWMEKWSETSDDPRWYGSDAPEWRKLVGVPVKIDPVPGSAEGKNYPWLYRKVLEAAEYSCHYCGESANTVDHVVPKVNGGLDEPSNLVAACISCNLSKGTKSYEEFTGVPFDQDNLGGCIDLPSSPD